MNSLLRMSNESLLGNSTWEIHHVSGMRQEVTHIRTQFFSCEAAALQVLMSLCLSVVNLKFCLIPRFPKVP